MYKTSQKCTKSASTNNFIANCKVSYILKFLREQKQKRQITFAIMRTQQLKSAVAVRGYLKHTFGDQDTPNADEALQENNVIPHDANSITEAMRNFRAKRPEQIRKNGVQCVELLITANHDVMM